jgi:hypothetical protein
MALTRGLALGRMILKLHDTGESSLPPESHGNVIAWYMSLNVSLMGFCVPTATSNRACTDHTALTFINNVMALAGTITTAVGLQFITGHNTFHYWVTVGCMQESSQSQQQLMYTNLSWLLD